MQACIFSQVEAMNRKYKQLNYEIVSNCDYLYGQM